MDNKQRIDQMTLRLTDALTPSHLQIDDDSHLHAGHAGAKSGKGHFTLTIKSAKLDGLTRVRQQQTIYQSLGSMMQTDIHALSIKIVD